MPIREIIKLARHDGRRGASSRPVRKIVDGHAAISRQPDCSGVDICYRTQSLENGLTSEEGQQKKDHEDNERHEKQDLRDAGRCSRKAREAEEAGNEGNHEKDQCPFQHILSLSRSGPGSGPTNCAATLVGLTVRAACLHTRPRGLSPQAAALASPDIADLS